MVFIARCFVHFNDNIPLGNRTDLRCSQGVFLPHVVWDIRPGDGLHRLFLEEVVLVAVLCLPTGLVSKRVGSVLFTPK